MESNVRKCNENFVRTRELCELAKNDNEQPFGECRLRLCCQTLEFNKWSLSSKSYLAHKYCLCLGDFNKFVFWIRLKVWNLPYFLVLKLIVSDGSVGLTSGGADSRIGIWSPVNYTLLKQISTHSVLCLKWLGPGTGYLASGGADFVINIYETKTFTFVRRLVGHTGMVYSLDVMTNGNLFSGSDDASVWIWNLNTGQKLVGYNPLSIAITGVKVISSGIVAVVGNKKTMMFIDATTSTGTSLTVALGSAILSGTLLYNSDQVFATAWSKTVTLINTNTYAFLLDIPTTYTTICLEYFPSGKFLDLLNREEIFREWLFVNVFLFFFF